MKHARTREKPNKIPGRSKTVGGIGSGRPARGSHSLRRAHAGVPHGSIPHGDVPHGDVPFATRPRSKPRRRDSRTPSKAATLLALPSSSPPAAAPATPHPRKGGGTRWPPQVLPPTSSLSRVAPALYPASLLKGGGEWGGLQSVAAAPHPSPRSPSARPPHRDLRPADPTGPHLFTSARRSQHSKSSFFCFLFSCGARRTLSSPLSDARGGQRALSAKAPVFCVCVCVCEGSRWCALPRKTPHSKLQRQQGQCDMHAREFLMLFICSFLTMQCGRRREAQYRWQGDGGKKGGRGKWPGGCRGTSWPPRCHWHITVTGQKRWHRVRPPRAQGGASQAGATAKNRKNP